MQMGILGTGAWNSIITDHVNQRQSEKILIKLTGLLSVAAAPGEVMKLTDGHEV